MAKRETLLHPGDRVELSVSLFVKHRGREAWIKVGGDVAVQAGEDGAEAAERLSEFLASELDLQVESLHEVMSD